MARNAAGTYTLPAGNPVEAATTIATSWANPTLEDVATALQDSLSRTGKGAMLAPFKAVSGLSTAPGITFNQEPQSGFYRAGAGDLRVALSGIDIFRLFNGQVQIWIPANSRWFNLVSAKGSGAVVETKTLIADQTVVAFTKNIAGAALYVNGTSGDRGRLFLGSDYTYDAVANEVTLATSYTDGTLLAAVVNDETDVQAAAAAASASAVAANTSKNAAASSATASQNSATASQNSATASQNSATAASNSAQSIANSAQAIATNTSNISGLQGALSHEVGEVILFAGNSTALNKKYGQGWRIADGTDGTPDLMDSFPKLGTFAQRTGTGGAKNITPAGGVSVSTSVNVLNHTLSLAQMPSHNHTFTGDAYSTGSTARFGGTSSSYSQNTNSQGSSNSHNHGASASSSGSFSGSSHTNEPQFTYLVPLYFTGVAGTYP